MVDYQNPGKHPGNLYSPRPPSIYNIHFLFEGYDICYNNIYYRLTLYTVHCTVYSVRCT